MTMPEDPVISTGALAERLGDEKFIVLDCRFNLLEPAAGAVEWRRGHIPGAVHADLDTVLAGPVTATSGRHPLPDPASLAAWLSGQGVRKDSHVVAYDAGSGAIAARAWWLLHWLGHERVSVLDGGIAAWEARGRPLAHGSDSRRSPGALDPIVRKNAVATTRDVETGLAGTVLVDAREAARYRGEIEPIDAVAGHIPGSFNLPYSENLELSGRWKEPQALSEIYQAVLGDARGADWIVMCGSGVTACHLAIGGVRAGYAMPRLYVGSWSEWIRDPDRPVEIQR